MRQTFLGILALIVGLSAGSVWADGCQRSEFGSWRQIKGLDTRARVLADRSVSKVTWNEQRTRVTRGSWVDRFSGRVLSDIDAGKVHIDHLVPVCWAWSHGADAWTRKQRKQFYNDPRFLLIVEASANIAKSDDGPDKVLPMNRSFACEYTELFLHAVDVYGLRLSPEEWRNMRYTRDLACRPNDKFAAKSVS